MTSPQTLLRLQLAGLALEPGEFLFQNTSATIARGQRIALIGPNGSGKSSMLRLLNGELPPGEGRIVTERGVRIAFVPQFPDGSHSKQPGQSTGERFQRVLHTALREAPDLLLLDEPGDCLDATQHAAFRRSLKRFAGAVCVATHDPDLLADQYDQIWAFASPLHPDGHGLHIFAGSYGDYCRECAVRRRQHAETTERLHADRLALKQAMVGDQERASGRRRVNRNENDRNRRGALRETASASGGQQRRRRERNLARVGDELRGHKATRPKHSTARLRFLTAVPGARSSMRTQSPVLSLRDASCQRGSAPPIFAPLSLDLHAGELIELAGPNGVGKSTLCAAIAQDPTALCTPPADGCAGTITRLGTWQGPRAEHCQLIGTHAGPPANLAGQSAVDWLAAKLPDLTRLERQRLLYDVGFADDAQLRRAVVHLSGGELLRLALARLCARPPQLLLLDEAHRHLDSAARELLAEALRSFLTAGGAVLMIAHSRLPENWPAARQTLQLRASPDSPKIV